MNNFTLIIPTHNRHHYLKRSIEYFKDLNANVIYCDSSSKKYEGGLYDNVSYLHLPGQNFAAKVLFALSRIETNFIALCADDDFIVIESLYKGFSFLNDNKNYKTLVGKYISFKDVFDGHYYPIYQQLPDDIDLSFERNAEVFFQNYYQVLWAMYDKEVLIKAFQIINEAKFYNDNFIELVIGTCACHAGGIKFLKEIWGVREITTVEHWGNRHASITSMQVAQVNEDYNKFKELVDRNTHIGYADKVMNSYLYGQKKNTRLVIRSKIAKVIPEPVKKIVKNIFLQKSEPKIVLDQINDENLHSITLLLKKKIFN
jgi:glycosyltransferase domain-containing protein